jgi:hypothetical protein
MEEIWKPIVGYEGCFEVSTFGRVRSVARMVRSSLHKTGFRSIPAKMKTATVSTKGYLQLGLSRGNVRITKRVADLVMDTFVGPKPHGLDVCHRDDNKLNNTLANLRYDTRQSNMEDAIRNGLIRRAEDAPRAKLSNAEVQAIRSIGRNGSITKKEIGEKFGVTGAHVGQILSWKTRVDG